MREDQTPKAIEDNARFFENKEEIPKFAITMGVGTIMEAKECLLLASGKNKAESGSPDWTRTGMLMRWV